MAKKITKDLTELETVLKANGVVLPEGEDAKKTPPQPSPEGREEDAKGDRFKNFSWTNGGKDFEVTGNKLGLCSTTCTSRTKEELEREAIKNIVMCGMISDDPDHEVKFRKYKYALQKLYPNATVWNPVTYVPKIKRWMFPFQKLTNDMALIICLRTIYKLSRKEGFMLGILPDCITSLGGMAEWKMGQAMKVKIERLEEVKSRT